MDRLFDAAALAPWDEWLIQATGVAVDMLMETELFPQISFRERLRHKCPQRYRSLSALTREGALPVDGIGVGYRSCFYALDMSID